MSFRGESGSIDPDCEAWKRSLGVLTFLVVLRAKPSDTLLDLLAIFTRRRGIRTGIYEFDRRGGFAILSVSVQGGGW
jgi:hypothetical protein